jgi:fructokinase
MSKDTACNEERNMNQQFTVAGIGELLWDVFPSHKRPGGAPTNFSCHYRRLGAQAYPVSCMGTDNLGLEIREELQHRDVDTSYVLTSDEFSTGTIQVLLDGVLSPKPRKFSNHLKSLA